MKGKLIQKNVIVKKSKMHGYGVFATKTIKAGQTFEQCYTIISRGGDRGLEDYYFDANGKYALLTGFGIIYNHSVEPNADYFINMKTRITTLKAARTIQKGEEIFVSYGDEWFDDRDFNAKKPKPVTKKKVKKKKRA